MSRGSRVMYLLLTRTSALGGLAMRPYSLGGTGTSVPATVAMRPGLTILRISKDDISPSYRRMDAKSIPVSSVLPSTL